MWRELWSAVKTGAGRGARDALLGLWTPVRARFWRFVLSEYRRGWHHGLRALETGYGLILEGRLDRHGRVR